MDEEKEARIEAEEFLEVVMEEDGIEGVAMQYLCCLADGSHAYSEMAIVAREKYALREPNEYEKSEASELYWKRANAGDRYAEIERRYSNQVSREIAEVNAGKRIGLCTDGAWAEYRSTYEKSTKRLEEIAEGLIIKK